MESVDPWTEFHKSYDTLMITALGIKAERDLLRREIAIVRGERDDLREMVSRMRTKFGVKT